MAGAGFRRARPFSLSLTAHPLQPADGEIGRNPAEDTSTGETALQNSRTCKTIPHHDVKHYPHRLSDRILPSDIGSVPE